MLVLTLSICQAVACCFVVAISSRSHVTAVSPMCRIIVSGVECSTALFATGDADRSKLRSPWSPSDLFFDVCVGWGFVAAGCCARPRGCCTWRPCVGCQVVVWVTVIFRPRRGLVWCCWGRRQRIVLAFDFIKQPLPRCRVGSRCDGCFLLARAGGLGSVAPMWSLG
jgi:hypothetical protein